MADTQNQPQTQQPAQDVEIDDTNAKYRTKVAGEIYSAFVESKNFKSSITIAPSNVVFADRVLTSSLAQSNTWDLALAPRILHSTAIERTADMTMTIQNIQFSADVVLNKGLYDGNCWAVSSTAEASTYLFDNMLGLPCPFVEGALSGFSMNPLLAVCDSIDVSWGLNNITNRTVLHETLQDVYNRMFDEDEIKMMDRSLIPDKVNDYRLFGKYATLPKYTQQTATPTRVLRPDGTYLDEIANDTMNPFSRHNRLIKASSITFKKAVKSPNYSWQPTAGNFMKDATDTDTLHTINVGGFLFPANCTQADYEASGISPFQAFFYYDKNNADAFTIRNGSSVSVPPVISGSATEPSGQSLTQIIYYQNLRSLLPCDELTMYKNNTFHNISRLSITENYRARPEEIVKFCLPYTSELSNICYQSGTNAIFQPVKYPAINGLQISLSWNQQTVRMKQFELPLELKVASTSTLAFLERTVVPYDLSSQLPFNPSSGKRQWSTTPFAFTTNPQQFNRVPYATMVFAYNRDDNNKDQLINRSAMKRGFINKLQFKIDGNDPILQSFTADDIYKMSKKNGLKNYDIDFIRGQVVQEPSVFTQDIKIGNDTNKIIAQNMKQVYNSIKKQYQVQNGNICLLRWGQDIPLQNNGLTASVSGLNSTLEILGTVSSDDLESGVFKLYVVHFYERELVFLNDGNCIANNYQITRNDYVKALMNWQGKVSSGRLYVNSATLRGGGLFSSAVEKVSSFLPKILPMVKKGLDWYNNNQGAVNGALGAVSSLASGDTSGAISQGRKALGDLLK